MSNRHLYICFFIIALYCVVTIYQTIQKRGVLRSFSQRNEFEEVCCTNIEEYNNSGLWGSWHKYRLSTLNSNVISQIITKIDVRNSSLKKCVQEIQKKNYDKIKNELFSEFQIRPDFKECAITSSGPALQESDDTWFIVVSKNNNNMLWLYYNVGSL